MVKLPRMQGEVAIPISQDPLPTVVAVGMAAVAMVEASSNRTMSHPRSTVGVEVAMEARSAFLKKTTLKKDWSNVLLSSCGEAQEACFTESCVLLAFAQEAGISSGPSSRA